MRAAFFLILAASPAAADLNFCNETDALATVAIGYSDDGTWFSEGWWRLEPGQCRAVIKGDLPKRYYYWRATSASGTLAEGGYSFCTQSGAFTIEGDADCEARGYQSAGFREEDIGEARDYWLSVTSTAAAPPQDQGPGTFGEPYTVVAEFRGCWAVAEELECEFFADDWYYVASEAGPTDLSIIDTLNVFSEGTQLQISGDLISYAGDRAEVMIRDWETVSAPAPQENQGPGTFGEPYTVVAEFRGCWAVAEEVECEFYADGWYYVASEAGPTDPGIIEALNVFSEGMRLQISGDLISYAGDRADVTIRDVEPAPGPAAPPEPTVSINGLMEHMQGFWDSDAGDGYTWIVEGNFLREIYDGNIMRESFFEIAPTCAASDGYGPVIIAWPEPDEGDGPSCYVVTESGPRHLAVWEVVEGNSYSFSYSN